MQKSRPSATWHKCFKGQDASCLIVCNWLAACFDHHQGSVPSAWDIPGRTECNPRHWPSTIQFHPGNGQQSRRTAMNMKNMWPFSDIKLICQKRFGASPFGGRPVVSSDVAQACQTLQQNSGHQTSNLRWRRKSTDDGRQKRRNKRAPRDRRRRKIRRWEEERRRVRGVKRGGIGGHMVIASRVVGFIKIVLGWASVMFWEKVLNVVWNRCVGSVCMKRRC